MRAALPRLSLSQVLFVACAVRLVWIALCANEPTSDQYIYEWSASVLAQGRGYIDESGNSTNYWPVGYPALLGAWYALFGAYRPIAFLLHLGLWLVAVVGMDRLGRELFGSVAGRCAALLIAVHPTFVLHTTLFASETPFLAGLPWALLALLRLAREPSRFRRFAPEAGLWIALLSYVRPTALLLLVCPLAFGLIRRVSWTRALLHTAAMGALAIALLAPWGVRNALQFGKFSVTSYNGGANLWMGNSEGSDGSYRPLPDEIAALPLVARDELLKQRALAFIAAEPATYVRRCFERLAISLRSDTVAAEWNRTGIERRFGERGVTAFKLLCSGVHWLLMAGGLVTLIRLGRRRLLSRSDAELAVVLGLLAAPFVLIVGGNRYMLPLVPLLALWLASALRDRQGVTQATWPLGPWLASALLGRSGAPPAAIAPDRVRETHAVNALPGPRAAQPTRVALARYVVHKLWHPLTDLLARGHAHRFARQLADKLARGLTHKLSLSFVVAVLAYGSLLMYAEFDALTSNVAALSAEVLATATLVASGNYVLRYMRWAYYLRLLRMRVRFVDSVLVFVSGFAMSITPAKLGEVLKSVLLRDAYDIPIARSAPIVIAERVTDVTGLLVLGGIGAWRLPGGPWIAALCFAGALALGSLIAWPRLGVWAIELASKLPKIRRVREQLLDAHGALAQMMTRRALALGTLLSIVAWGTQGAALALIARGYSDVTLTLDAALLSYCAPLLAGTLAMVPGGLGLTEASMTGVLRALGGPSATPAVAAAITIVVRVITFWFAILLGFGALFVWYARRSRKAVRAYS